MQRDEGFLLDMLIAVRDAEQFLEELSLREFEESRLHQSAVIKVLEIIGEAANRISEGNRQIYSEIPWNSIIGMRNRLVHGYLDVDLKRVWNTVKNDIPPLIATLDAIVPTESSDDKQI